MENKYMEKLDKFKEFLDSGSTKANITKVALIALSLAALPGLILPAAAVGIAIRLIDGSRYGKKYSKKQIQDAILGIHRRKLIEYVADKDGKTIVKITKKGESKLRAFSIELIKIKKPVRWDDKWRLVIFDIPIRFSKSRHAFRFKLQELGFVQLQKSSWIYPYPCEDEVLFVADFYGVGKYIEILTIESFLNENKLKNHFEL